jgi:hypothetical protein
MEKFQQPAFVIVQKLTVSSHRGASVSRVIVGGTDTLEEAEKIRDWFESNVEVPSEDEYYMGPTGYFNYEVMRP